MKTNKKILVTVLLVPIIIALLITGCGKNLSDEDYIAAVKEAYLPGMKYKHINIDQFLKGLARFYVEERVDVNMTEEDVEWIWKVSRAKEVGDGTGRYVLVMNASENIIMSFWVNQDGSYVEFVKAWEEHGGEADAAEFQRFVEPVYDYAVDQAGI